MFRASFVALVLLPTLASAQDLTFAWQGRLLDVDGAPYTGQTSVVVRLYDTSSATTEVWDDTFSVTAEDGFISLLLGEPTNPIEVGDLSTGTAYIEVDVGSAPVVPRTAIHSVPFAGRAASIPVATSAPSESDCVGKTGAVFFDSSDGTLYVCDGTEWRGVGAAESGGSGGVAGAGDTVGYYGIDNGSTVTHWSAVVTLGETTLEWTGQLTFNNSVSDFCNTHGFPIGAIKTQNGDMGVHPTYYTSPTDGIIAGNGPLPEWVRLVGNNPRENVYTNRRHDTGSNTGYVGLATLATSGNSIASATTQPPLTDPNGHVLCQTDIPISTTPSL